ncbi:MAG: tryptophan synthase subunit alpha [Candidatus Omnitrophota bacterium]
MNRIEEKILNFKRKKKKIFVAYITAGFPEPDATIDIVRQIEKDGVDIIELGMPFSDPIADGPTIQKASALALKKGMNLKKFLNLVKCLRKKTQIPLIMMSYYNPIFNYGIKKFTKDAGLAGLDGVIIPDLPPEESTALNKFLKKEGILQIFLISPVTQLVRMQKIVKITQGFIYYISLTGVTGIRKKLPQALKSKLKSIKKITNKSVFVGFGISRPQQVKSILKDADGIIIGSAIIKILQLYMNRKERLKKLSQYIQSIKRVTFFS